MSTAVASEITVKVICGHQILFPEVERRLEDQDFVSYAKWLAQERIVSICSHINSTFCYHALTMLGWERVADQNPDTERFQCPVSIEAAKAWASRRAVKALLQISMDQLSVDEANEVRARIVTQQRLYSSVD